MTSTAHAMVAGAIAAHFSNPVTAIGIAITTHFIMDSIPHWDLGTDWRSRSKMTTGIYAILETLFGITLAITVYHSVVAFPLLLITIIASVLPDWLEAPWYIWYANQRSHGPSKKAGLIEKISYGFYKIPNVFHAKAQLPFGILTQIIMVGFFLLILK